MTVYILEGFFAQTAAGSLRRRAHGRLCRLRDLLAHHPADRRCRRSSPPSRSTSSSCGTSILFAVVLLTDDEKRTLPLGIMHFMGGHQLDVGMVATGLMIAIAAGDTALCLVLRNHDQGHDGGRSALAPRPAVQNRGDVATVTDRRTQQALRGRRRAGREGREPRRRRRGVHGAARAVGLRQVVGAAHDRRPRADHLGNGRDRRPAW